MTSNCATVIKFDHHFDFAARLMVPTVDGREHPFSALFTAVDEYGRILCYQLCKTKALSEVRPGLLALKERHKLHVRELPLFSHEAAV